MIAVAIGEAGDAGREGRARRCRCPLHSGRRILTATAGRARASTNLGVAAIGRVSQEEQQ
jgi:hypothetical protein